MRILAVSGASGGHIFPAISFLQRLKKCRPDSSSLLVLPERSREKQISAEVCAVEYISSVSLSLKLDKKNLSALLKFFKGAAESLRLLLKFKPDIVVGFGSLDSLAIMLWAWILRIPTLIHEQNVVPGRANRLLAKFCDKVAISFSQTKEFLEINPQRIIVTGNPIREDLKVIKKQEALDFFGLESGKFTVLVTGGSQGSRRINLSFLAAMQALPERDKIQAVHISGQADFAFLKQAYSELNAPVKLFAFLPQMQYAYCAADLVISRAGATTIAELAFFKAPAVLVPYPFARAHQLSNARVLEKTGAAIIIEDRCFDADNLSGKLSYFLYHAARLGEMRRGYAAVSITGADELLVQAALSLN